MGVYRVEQQNRKVARGLSSGNKRNGRSCRRAKTGRSSGSRQNQNKVRTTPYAPIEWIQSLRSDCSLAAVFNDCVSTRSYTAILHARRASIRGGRLSRRSAKRENRFAAVGVVSEI